MNQTIGFFIAIVVIVNAIEGDATKVDDVLVSAEQNAGKAVLKLLDAKIGKKVQDAAKEVTDFLTSAIGHHATTRSDNIRKDKQKEMSLLHLGAVNTIKDDVKKHQDKPQLKKKKDGSFLVHFKIPYIVTPLNKKKHHHHHHHHKHHYHHHHKHHAYHHKPAAYDKPPSVEIHRQPYHSQALSPYHHPGTVPPSPYTQTHSYPSATPQAAGGSFTPCQGMCTAPCTPECTPATDCCCCPNPNAAVAPSAVPVSLTPPAAMPPPPNPNQPPLTSEQFNALPLSPGSCLPFCKRHCIAKCPRECCGTERKRDKVEKPGDKKEDKPEKKEETKQESEPKPKGTEDQQLEKTQSKNTDDQQTKVSEDQRDEGSANEAIDDDVE